MHRGPEWDHATQTMKGRLEPALVDRAANRRASGGRAALLSTAAIFCLHFLGLVLIFTPASGIVDGAPLIDQDWGVHFHHLRSLEAFWQQDRRLWGYNPYFMAGYPSNTIQDLSIKLYELLALALSSIALTPVQWFKISAFLAMASVPWMLYASARNFFWRRDARQLSAVMAALLGTVYWWSSLPREMFFYGMIGFAAASYLSILGASLFYRLAVYPSTASWVAAGWLLFAVVIVPLHVQAAVIFVPPILVLLAAQPLLITRRLLLWGSVAALVSAAANSPWLITAFHHRSDSVAAAIVEELPLFATPSAFTFVLDYLGTEGYWTFRPSPIEKGFRISLLILGLLGIHRLLRNDRALGSMLAAATALLFGLAYFGSLSPFLKAWQPLRFKIPLDLFLVIGAAAAAAHWWLAPAARRSRLGPLVLAGGLTAFAINLVQTESRGHLQLRSRPMPHMEAIADWIVRETSAEARVLFEESGDETGFVYGGVYLSSLLPYWTGRQLVGGPINLQNDRHHFAGFHSGRLFHKDIRTLSAVDLAHYLELYNIGSVIAFHPASVERLHSIPGLVTTQRRIGPVHLMEVHRAPSWFLAGEGRVRASWNRLELSEVKGEEVILSYHWVQGLRGEPEVTIVPIRLADDPIPFIKLLEPPPELTLRVGS